MECLASAEQVLRLRGGGKKRKKKTYTKPKKVKHVHKTVKLAALKYYRVDDNGKVHRLRKVRGCGGAMCGESEDRRRTLGRSFRGRGRRARWTSL